MLCAPKAIWGCLFVSSLLMMPDNAAANSWDFDGQVRMRYESLDGQFRIDKTGSDQLLLMRSLLHGRYNTDEISWGFEIQDSRTYLGDSGTPLSSSYTNSFDALQLYVKTDAMPSVWQDSEKSELTVGRQTISIGSKRQIERVSFANVIKSYTGVYWQDVNNDGDELHSFYVVPVKRLPSNRSEIDDNTIKADKEQWQRRMWGLHYRKANLIPDFLLGSGAASKSASKNVWGELFAYGLDESDTSEHQTPNRHYVTTGFRLYRPWAPQDWNFDIEGAYRFGSRHETSSANDNDDLTVSASMLMFRLGYTFNHPYNPNLAFQYYFASGDKSVGDDKFDQFERLFGGRRTDLNNTSIHGPLTPANLSAIGMRLTLSPSDNWDARLHYSAAYLAEGSDKFVIGKYQDVSRQAGDFLGHTLDSRLRFAFNDKRWIIDVGMSLFYPGDYLKTVRGADKTERTTFGYAQLSYQF